MKQHVTAEQLAKKIKHERRTGNYDQAIILGENYLSTFEENPRVLCSLGSAYAQRGQTHRSTREQDYKNAFSCFCSALAIDPKDEVAHTSLGQLALVQDKHDEAFEHFERALNINPKNKVALLLSLRTSLKIGNMPEAIRLVNLQLEYNLHLPTMQVARIMAEHNIGGEDFKQKYDTILNFGQTRGLISNNQIAKYRLERRTTDKEALNLSVDAWREIDTAIGEGVGIHEAKYARSAFFEDNQVHFPHPINHTARLVGGIPTPDNTAHTGDASKHR